MQFSKTYREETRQQAGHSVSVQEVSESQNFFRKVLQIVHLYTNNTVVIDLAKTFTKRPTSFRPESENFFEKA